MKKIILSSLIAVSAFATEIEVSEHYGMAMEAYTSKDWSKMVHHCRKVKTAYPRSHFAQEIGYYWAVGYFNKGDYARADQLFTQYLRTQSSPKFFEEAIQYKFEIANLYEAGTRKHLFGAKALPRLLNGYEDAVRIYDEVITSLPNHEMAAEALFKKATLLVKFEDYKESIETFQTLIRRFPKHHLGAESYLQIAGVFLKQASSKFPDPAYLELAEINLRKFRRDFPGEPRINEAESNLQAMREEFADELFRIGSFYQKTKKLDSAAIYYSTIILRYPHTPQAFQSEKRLKAMGREIPQEGMMALPADRADEE